MERPATSGFMPDMAGLFLPPFEAVHLVFVQSLSEHSLWGCVLGIYDNK